TPTLSSATQTSGGFYFTITNYSSSNGYNLSTTAGSVSRSGSTVTVSGLSSGQSATVTVVATRSGYSNSDAATITASSTSAVIPTISSFTATLGNLSGNLQYVDLNWVATNQASWSITGFNGSFSGTTETGKANYVLTATSYTVTLTITSSTGNTATANVSFTTSSPAPTIITYPVASISGNTLSVTTGTWNYNPSSYQYQWYLYNDGTGQWGAISGQNGANFNISSYIGTYTQAYAQVRAYNGNNSNWESSNTVTFSPPYTPTGVSATGLSSTSIRISWSPALYAASYEIYFAFTNSYPIYQSPNFSGITGTSFDHTGLASSTVVYYYWVRATNSYGTSAYSSPAASSTVLLNFPVNTVAPTISGSQIGSTISASTGSWTNSPTSYAYSWQVFTLGDWYQFQTAQSFTLQSSYNVPGAGTTSMSGKSIKVTVAATNAAGTGYADSSAVTVGSAPSYYAAPAYYATPVYYAAPPAYYAAPVYYAAPPAYYAAPVYTAFLCSSQDVIDGYCSYINQCSGSANTGGSCTCSPSNIPC
ncbi:fibronectin type III domain-containing protein, partial [bacterium]|nr:fibronectin type III domain-containing protein [bacterium]